MLPTKKIGSYAGTSTPDLRSKVGSLRSGSMFHVPGSRVKHQTPNTKHQTVLLTLCSKLIYPFGLWTLDSNENRPLRAYFYWLVPTAGFEPAAPRLGIWCSILLSYVGIFGEL